MVKKKRQTNQTNDGSSTESCDEKSTNNSPISNGPNSIIGCKHIKRSVDLQKLQKLLKNINLEKDNCVECSKNEKLIQKNEETNLEELEYDKTLWLCLKCGSQLCGKTKNKHALEHFNTPRSDSHALVINTTTFKIWCYKCAIEINPLSNKKLSESVKFITKVAQKPPALNLKLSSDGDENIKEINNIEQKIRDTLNTMPFLNDSTTTTTVPNSTSKSILLNCYPNGIPLAGPSVEMPSCSSDNIVKRPLTSLMPTTNTSFTPVVTTPQLPRVRGLTNLGNTCYFNAVLQCLAQTPYLLEILKEASEPGEEFTLPGGDFTFTGDQETNLPPIKGKLSGWGSLTSALAEALEELQTEGAVFRPGKIFGKLTAKCPQFRGGEQHDSHELLRHLLESVKSEDLKRYQKVILHHIQYAGQELSDVDTEMKQKCKIYGQQAADRILRPEQVFRGFLVSTLTCQDCFHISSRHENFLDMSLPVSVEKPQPPTRRKTSPDSTLFLSSSAGPSKHQLKKEKDKEKKAKRALKHQNKRQQIGQNLAFVMGPAGDNGIMTESSPLFSGPTCQPENNSSTLQFTSSSSDEQSDADVEDNLIDDAPKRGVVADRTSSLSSNVLPEVYYDPNGNNEISSPVNPEKRGDSPENPNKDSNDENDSGIATSPANINGDGCIASTNAQVRSNDEKNYIDEGTENSNLVLSVGISEKGASYVRQNTSDKLKNNGSAVGNFLNHELNNLNLKEQEILEIKKKAKQKRIRTQSHSDWCSTIAPRYLCEDGECSIQSCLNNFTAVELMTGNNKVGCDGCTQRYNGENGKTVYTNATKQFLISSPPAVLILHLKRFQVGQRCMFRKLTRSVSFPMVLDIAPFCGSKVKNLPNINRKQKRLVYALYGIVEHSGGMYGGHYTAYVKVRPKISTQDNRWKFMPQGSKAELDQTDEQKAKLDELLAKEKERELRMKANDSDDYSSSNSSSEQDDTTDDTVPNDENGSAEEELEGAVGGSINDEPNIVTPPGKWYYVSDSHVREVSEDSVLEAQAYLLFYERIY